MFGKRNFNFNLDELIARYEKMMEEKKELLYQFEKLEKKGIHIGKKFTLSSNLDEMRAEYDTIKRQRDTENSVKFQKKMLMI